MNRTIALLTLILLPFLSNAEVTKIAVKQSGYLGQFNGYEYQWVTADMYGSVDRDDGSTGMYRVPLDLIYPTNKPPLAGFVDLINSASFVMYHENEAPEGRRVVYRNGELILGDFLWMNGLVYAGLQWSKMVTELKGAEYGVIEDGRDGYQIINDIARYLKNPTPFIGDEAKGPEAVEHVVSMGYSQTAKLQYSMLMAGLNREADGSVVYDGMLAGAMGAGGTCMVLSNDSTIPLPPDAPNPVYYTWDEPCEGDLPPDTKYIAALTQSDVILFSGYRDRRDLAHYRQYEFAGISHIPPDQLDFRLHGSDRQNPISFKPAMRALTQHLLDWVLNSIQPPESVYIAGEIDSEGQFNYKTDADGNVLGGIRFPHMQRKLVSEEVAGAPLGKYTGIDESLFGRGFSFLSGTFEPFSPSEMRHRYPDSEEYIGRVESATRALIEEGFLLPEDQRKYVSKARIVAESW